MESPSEPIQFQAPSIEELGPYFPSYEIEDFIAQGGMGAVYLARQISLDRSVAIKILPREFGEDPTFRESFEAEAKAMAKLNHPNLISVYDFGEVNGMLFLIMEFVHGKSLYYSSHGKSIDPTQAAEIVISVCEGLDHAHEAGILHRDVKPANILLCPNATPKIGDFGLASPMNETANADDVVYGTPGYTAPEVIHRLQVDRRADVFSTGVMLYELLTGALPDASRTPPSVISGCPAAYDAIVARSTHPSPELRYGTTAEFADDLKKALTAAPVANRLNLNPAAAPALPRRSAALPAPAKKSPVMAITLGLIAVAAGIAYLATQVKDSPQPAAAAEEVVATTPPPSIAPPQVKKPAPPEPQPKPLINVATKPEAKKESPRKELERLKPQLASGKRDAFPRGTVEHNGSHFFLIKQPMKQDKAIEFADEHGGHLAIAPTQEDKQFLLNSLPLKKPVWVGAGIAAYEKWQWMDDSIWNVSDKISTTSADDRHALLTTQGALVAADNKKAHEFIIQWRHNGSNPCSLESQLNRTAASIAKSGIDQARYPVGTRTYQKSHFLLIPKALNWENTYQLAKSNKANLPVPSSEAEQVWILKNYSEKATSLWLGGYLLDENSPWRWTSKERFNAMGWKPGEPSSDISKNRILCQLGGSSENACWISSEGKRGEASHTLLEWSQPVTAASSTASFDLDKWLTGVNRKIADRVKPLVEKYDKERDQEISSYIRDMKRAAKKFEIPGGRRGGGRGGDFMERLVESAMNEVEESGELPENLPERAPEVFKDLTESAQKSLTKLETEHQVELKKQLDFYAQGLLKKADEIAKSGFTRQAEALKQTIDEIGEDTGAFTSKLGL